MARMETELMSKRSGNQVIVNPDDHKDEEDQSHTEEDFHQVTRSFRVVTLAFLLLAGVSILTGTLVVCLTLPRQTKTCSNSYRTIIVNSTDQDTHPRSVAVADLNNDGILDVVVAKSGIDSIGVFFGTAHGTYLNHINYSTGSGSIPYSLTIDDFNQDRKPDIIVANFGSHSIAIFLNDGNGNFSQPIQVSTGIARPVFIATGLLNGDHILDLIVINHGTHDISIYLGSSDQTVRVIATYFMGYDSFPSALVVGDFDGDKHQDMAVVNNGTSELIILYGNGDGTFSRPISYVMSHAYPSSIAVADMNNDQRLDLVVANVGTRNVGVFLGNSDGTFNVSTRIPLYTHASPQYVTTGDFNNDHHVDLLVVDAMNALLYIIPGLGNGSFSNVTIYISENQSQPFAAAVADLDHDNRSDIALVNYGRNNLKILMGYSTRLSAKQTAYSVGRHSRPSSLAIGDFNHDQLLGIVVAKSSSDSIGVLVGAGNGSFTAEISYSTGAESAPSNVAVGDLNQDSHPDIVVANYGTHTVGILFGDGQGNFAPIITYSTGVLSYPIFVALGDFNNDHALDMTVVNFRADNIVIFLNSGNGSFVLFETYSTGAGSDPKALVIGDFDNDHQLDIAVANSADNNVGLLMGNGDGTFQPMITYNIQNRFQPDSIVADDFNGDHFLDIVVADSTSDNLAILLSTEDGIFAEPMLYSHETFANPSGLVVGDFNNDRVLDIAVANFGSDNIGILIGTGNGSFSFNRSYQLTVGAGPLAIAIGDFNRNNRWDIVVAQSGLSNVNVLVEYVAANFEQETVYSTGQANRPYSVVAADMNHDNHSDIIVANSGTNNVGVFFTDENGTLVSEIMVFAGSNSHPQHVRASDLNGDQHLDIITANTRDDSISVILGFGNGTFADPIKYPMGVNSQPSWVVIDDMNNDQRLDLIVANQQQDNIAVLLGYDYSSFQDQDAYESVLSEKPSSIYSDDFNNDTFLDIVATFAASDCIGLLLGHGNGSFSTFTIYSTGTGSYPYEVLSGDVNGDHAIDIVVANPGTDSIGVLLGHGNGTFAPIQIHPVVNGSRPYGAALGDLDGDQQLDIVVANYRGNSVGVLYGDGHGGFDAAVLYPLADGARPLSVAVGDLNGDGMLDIVVANSRLDHVRIFINSGNRMFRSLVSYSTGYLSMPTFVIIDDFNQDRLMDIAVSNKFTDSVGILYNRGNATFRSVVSYSTGDGSSPHCIRSGDFNQDRILDIAVVNPGKNDFAILYGTKNRGFLLGPSQSTGQSSGSISLAVGDFDGDGRMDVSTANYLSHTIGVHLNRGSQLFGSTIVSSTGFRSSPSALAVGDFNEDGYTDVVVANAGTNTIGVLFGHGNGHFTDAITYSTGSNSHPVEISAADVNNDNRSDIVVVNPDSNNVYIFVGNGNGTFCLRMIYNTGVGSRPYGVTLGDLNNDHFLDLIVVTAGTNRVLLIQGYGNGTFGNETWYPLSYNYDPYAVVTADFNGDDRLDIAVANYGGNNVAVLLQSCE